MAEVTEISREESYDTVRLVLDVNGQEIEIVGLLADCSCQDSHVDISWKAKLVCATSGHYHLVNRMQIELGRMPTGEEIRKRLARNWLREKAEEHSDG